jgi:hypothetical protein
MKALGRMNNAKRKYSFPVHLKIGIDNLGLD